MKELGRMEKVELRDVWQNEASHFTPWLAGEENIALLGNTIGIDLEVEAQEQSVGPFRADILCKDVGRRNWVLIENQLERTDHNHLGQLLTYAAGLEAVTIVWVAQTFTDEHRAALDWLNEKTGDGVDFFGLEIELWRIGESQAAPKFNVVSKPNSWSRSVKEDAIGKRLSETEKLHLAYWTAFRAFVQEGGSLLRCQKPYPQNFMNFSIGRSDLSVWAKANTRNKELGVALWIGGAERLARYRVLENKYKNEIEHGLGNELVWRELPEAQGSSIETVPFKADPLDRSDWGRQHGWIKETVEAFQRVLGPIVRNLEPEALDEGK